MEKADIKSLTLNELNTFLSTLNQPSYRAAQIFKWLYRGITDFDEMTDLSKELRNILKEKAFIDILETEKKLVSKTDGTVKYLFRLKDGEHIESVVMSYKHGNSICISSQVGCKMGCAFCASTIGGFKRNLTAAEMLNQIIFAQNDYGQKIGNIVIMGIGEPLDNYTNVLVFLENINSKEGLNISHRHISLSTCGIVDKINDLAKKRLQITVSVSLHAPNDAIRNRIMPINKKWDIDELIKSCHYYIEETGRRISFEYTLIDGVNDSLECADELAQRLAGLICHVNLIAVNPIREKCFSKSSAEMVAKFQKRLLEKGINATVRRVLGADINASCGQLRADFSAEGIGEERI